VTKNRSLFPNDEAVFKLEPFLDSV
jgi:hypothetical protein